MKALKTAATLLLAALLLASALAAESVALLKWTVLNPGFYGQPLEDAYALAGQTVVRRLSEAVLERAPAVALRTTNKERAYELASAAMSPRSVAKLLESSGPDIARFLVFGGTIPVLKGTDALSSGMTDAVKSLLMDGFWDLLPDKPSFPAFLPFTPEWNLQYGPGINQSLWLLHYYTGFLDQTLWLALSAVVLFAGLLRLLWMRSPKVFYSAAGVLLLLNCLLLLALAGLISYGALPMAQSAAVSGTLASAAGLFGSAFNEMVRAVLWPFRAIFLYGALLSFAFAVTVASMGVENGPALTRAIRPARGRHGKRCA